MNRRNFLKFSALTGLAAVMLPTIVIDYRDDETRFIDHLLTTYDDEILILGLVKTYGFVKSDGQLINFLRDFAQRQPGLMEFFKSRIQMVGVDERGSRLSNNERYNKMKRSSNIEFNCKIERLWNDDISVRFNYPKVDEYYTKWVKETDWKPCEYAIKNRV